MKVNPHTLLSEDRYLSLLLFYFPFSFFLTSSSPFIFSFLTSLLIPYIENHHSNLSNMYKTDLHHSHTTHTSICGGDETKETKRTIVTFYLHSFSKTIVEKLKSRKPYWKYIEEELCILFG